MNPRPPKPLTAKQQRIWDMRAEGKTRPQILAELGISESTLNVHIRRIKTKLKIPEAIKEAEQKVVQEKADEVNEAMKRSGFPERVRNSIIRRINVKHNGLVTDPKRLSTPEITGMIEEKIHLALTYMDDKVMAEASFRDLSVGTSALIEKRALLRGEPTQILSNHERAKLAELTPLLIAEAKRRGLTLDGQVTEKVVEAA